MLPDPVRFPARTPARCATVALACLLALSGCDSKPPRSAAADAPAQPPATSVPAPAANPQPQPEPSTPAPSPSPYAREFASPAEFEVWLRTFYQRRDFDRVPAAMGYYCASPLYNDEDGRFAMAAFLGEVFKQDDGLVARAWDALASRRQSLYLLLYAAWFADTPSCQQRLIAAREQWKDDPVLAQFLQDLFQNSVFNPFITDSMNPFFGQPVRIRILLSRVYANEDLDALLAVIGTLNLSIAPENSGLRPVGQTAFDAIAGLVVTDRWVRAVCERQVDSHPKPDVRRVLRQILGVPDPSPQRPR
jgi:hypothetical protein